MTFIDLPRRNIVRPQSSREEVKLYQVGSFAVGNRLLRTSTSPANPAKTVQL